MSYCMQQRDSSFEIKKEKITVALQAVHVMTQKRGHSWVINSNVAKADTLQRALEEWCWEIYEDGEGNVVGIIFEGEKLGDDEELFSTLAPYVEAGSFIEMVGEEGGLWRWTFDGNEMEEKKAEINWK